MNENMGENMEQNGNEHPEENMEQNVKEKPEEDRSREVKNSSEPETLGSRIARLRKEKKMTQDQLAGLMGVTFQAVSKWENDLACPDVVTLPALADIFEISLDALFGREKQPTAERSEEEQSKEERLKGEYSEKEESREEKNFLPWEDDGKIRIVVFDGNRLFKAEEIPERIKKISVELEGDVRDMISYLSVTCDNVYGSITAGASVTCDDVAGDVNAGGGVTCDDVEGNIMAGGDVTCGDVEGSIRAEGSVYRN